MNVVTRTAQNADQTGSPRQVQPLERWLLLWLVVALFAGLVAAWHWFDHSLPAPDDSSYILASFKYADLLRHPRFWGAAWWHEMLTVNRLYPPTVMMFNGVLRLFCGPGHWVDALSAVIFNGLLTASVYGTTRILTGNGRSAIIAAVLVNFYPEISAMSHLFLLDGPLVSMVSCGLLALVWWRDAPGWRRALVCGVILGLSCLTKQIAATYLLFPGIFCLAEGIRWDRGAKRWVRTPQLLATAGVTALVGMPWLAANLGYIRWFARYNQSSMGPISLSEALSTNSSFYAGSLPSVMSPLLFVAFLASLVLIDKSTHKRLLPVALCGAGGVLSICTLTWIFPSLRYVAPALVATAIYTACAMSRLVEHRFARVAVWGVLALGVVQYVSFNFAPYPLPASAAQLSEKMGVELVEIFGLTARDRREMRMRHSNPLASEDWGQEWALKTIDLVEGGKPVYLNILPDYVQLNGNTFELLGRMLGSPVRPTTSRKWTVMGDEIKFSPETAMYFQWYLLKSGAQGNILRDDASERDYARLIDFVTRSGKFEQVGSHRLPDGSTMFLWRQKGLCVSR